MEIRYAPHTTDKTHHFFDVRLGLELEELLIVPFLLGQVLLPRLVFLGRLQAALHQLPGQGTIQHLREVLRGQDEGLELGEVLLGVEFLLELWELLAAACTCGEGSSAVCI